MKVRFRIRYLQQCEFEVESNEFDTLRQCIADLCREIDTLDDSMLKFALKDQISVLTYKIEKEARKIAKEPITYRV